METFTHSAMRVAIMAVTVLGCRAVDAYRVPVPLGLDLFAPVPAENPLTRGRVDLGRTLFFDPVLSADRRVSCASCHRPDHTFSDTSSVSLGANGRAGSRNAPSLVNAVYRGAFAWDGRGASLEDQVLRPIQNPVEMDLALSELEQRLRAQPSYSQAFRREFGDGPTARAVMMALASYLRTLRSGDAPIDRYRAGDTTALSATARLGFALFIGKAGCSTCHVGPLFTDGDFHNTGVAWRDGRFDDDGRAGVTGLAEDRGRFKTPSLRNVGITAPYMHNGSKRSLADVIEFYDAGGQANPGLDPFVRPLYLTTDEKAALIEFLGSLTRDTLSIHVRRTGR